MIENNMTVKVTNRDNGSVGYSVPDLGVHRTFQPKESKEISAEELRKLSYLPGGDVIIKDYLIIHNEELLKELLGEVEPEYYYSEDEVKTLLLSGSLEQLQDCLDFAPNGVIDLIKSLAVNLKIDNVSKRKAIQDKTGFNVTRAIEINEETAKCIGLKRPSVIKTTKIYTGSRQKLGCKIGDLTNELRKEFMCKYKEYQENIMNKWN